MKLFVLVVLACVLALVAPANVPKVKCEQNKNCIAPKCRCMTTSNPLAKPIKEIPQFVMVTYDDAINTINYDALYRDLFTNMTRKNPKGCNIGATFFASHEYNNYAHMNNLYRYGSEIAIHTITHESSTEAWKTFNEARWKSEVQGMRDMIALHAKIPVDDIKGFRSPFLQTAGDSTFKITNSLGLYDSSMPTLKYAKTPIWPYTLDFGYTQDCVVAPCPQNNYPGMWIIPMVNYFKLQNNGGIIQSISCSMADACTPQPTTADDTYKYLMDNFNRHYKSTRAPFPLFLHESWLKDVNRKAGYLRFLDDILAKGDVYAVPVQEVLAYMKNPKTLAEYKQSRCVTKPADSECTYSDPPSPAELNGIFCNYDDTLLGGPRIIYVCDPSGTCPETYPWLNNIEGNYE